MITKGKKYLVFGNFPDAEGLATRLNDSLGIECLAFMSNTDNVSFVEYEEEDSKLIETKKELNKIFLEKNELRKENDKLKEQVDYYKKNWSKKLF